MKKDEENREKGFKITLTPFKTNQATIWASKIWFFKIIFFKKFPDRAARDPYRAERETFCQMGQSARWARPAEFWFFC